MRTHSYCQSQNLVYYSIKFKEQIVSVRKMNQQKMDNELQLARVKTTALHPMGAGGARFAFHTELFLSLLSPEGAFSDAVDSLVEEFLTPKSNMVLL